MRALPSLSHKQRINLRPSRIPHAICQLPAVMSYAYANAAPRTTPVYANARTAVLRIARLFIAMLLNVSMSRCIPVHAHRARHSGWDLVRGLPLRPADMGSASMRPER